MKRFLKDNFLTILLLCIMLVSLCIGCFKLNKYLRVKEEKTQETKELCESFNGIYDTKDKKDFCEKVINEEMETTFFEVFGVLVLSMPISSDSSFILIILLIFCNTFYVTKVLKNKVLNNFLQRESYKRCIIKIVKTSYFSAVVLPVTLILEFLISYLFSGNFLYDNFSFWSETTVANFPIFLIILFTVTILTTLIYSNICLLVSRKKHHFIISGILSFIVIMGIELFLEIVVSGLIFKKLLKTDIGIIFNILNPCSFNDSHGLILPLIFITVMFVITAFMVYIFYKDKEKLIIDCEAND